MSDLRKKQTQRTEETKRALKEAFCRLYVTKPINKISITEVCRIAGYNRSTFYQYYLDLDDILLEIENETLDYIKSRRTEIASSDSNFISELMLLYEGRKVYMDAMLGQNSTPRFFNTLISIATTNITDFDFDKNDPRYPYLVEFRYKGALSIFRLWIQRNRDLDFEDLLLMIRKMYQI